MPQRLVSRHLLGAAMDDLEDVETGMWAVATQTGGFLIDLDRRRMARVDSSSFRARVQEPGETPLPEPSRHRSWAPLLELLRCRVGRTFFALTDLGTAGGLTVRESTLVCRIRRVRASRADPDGEARA
jgi:hypothetical protein